MYIALVGIVVRKSAGPSWIWIAALWSKSVKSVTWGKKKFIGARETTAFTLSSTSPVTSAAKAPQECPETPILPLSIILPSAEISAVIASWVLYTQSMISGAVTVPVD